MTSNQDTTTIDDSVIEALRPQSRRYDVSIDTDLVLSVLPNGVKTWTWVFDDPADPHRKTLGIYPDMSLEDAKKSLASEKASYRRAASDNATPAFVIRDGRIQPAEASALRLPIIAGTVIAVLAIAMLAWFLTGRDNDSETPATSAVPAAAAPGVAAQDEAMQRPAATGTAASADPADAAASEAEPTDTVDAQTQSQVAAINQQLEAELERLKALERAEADTTEPVAPPATQPPPAEADAEPERLKALDRSETDPTEPVAPPAEADAEPLAAAPVAVVSARTLPPTPDSVAVAEPVPSLPPGARPAAPGQPDVPGPRNLLTDSRIARGILTTAVIQREPVDDLGTTVGATGEDMQTYYFFTELRNLAGQRVRHRWLQGDRVIAEVSFNVGEAWRWRVFSSKTFIPSMAGPWRVQVVLDDDTVIYSLPFAFTP